VRTSARAKHQREFVAALTRGHAGPLFPHALIQTQDDPRQQRLIQESIELRRSQRVLQAKERR
jgi:hypothetical protein